MLGKRDQETFIDCVIFTGELPPGDLLTRSHLSLPQNIQLDEGTTSKAIVVTEPTKQAFRLKKSRKAKRAEIEKKELPKNRRSRSEYIRNRNGRN
jgi:hypothetical protein